jgi:hypothetical protein
MQTPSRGGPLEWHSENGNAVSTAFRLRHLGTGLYLAAVPSGAGASALRRSSVSATSSVGGAGAPSGPALTSYSSPSSGRVPPPGGALASNSLVLPGLLSAAGGRAGLDLDKGPATPAQTALAVSAPHFEGSGSAQSAPSSSSDKGKSAVKGKPKDDDDDDGDDDDDDAPPSVIKAPLPSRRSVSPNRSAAYMASAAILRSGGSLVPKTRVLEAATASDKSPPKGKGTSTPLVASEDRDRSDRGDRERDVSPVRPTESFADAAARKVLKRPVPGGALNINPAHAGVLVGVRPKSLGLDPGAAPVPVPASAAAPVGASALAPVARPSPGPHLDLSSLSSHAAPPPPPPMSPKKKVEATTLHHHTYTHSSAPPPPSSPPPPPPCAHVGSLFMAPPMPPCPPRRLPVAPAPGVPFLP